MAQRTTRLWLAGLVLLVLIAYGPVLLRGGWIWDDDMYVTQNPTLRTAEGLGQIWANSAPEYNKQYYPLVHTSFWLEYHLWGLATALPYHLDNVLLQALNAVLVWIILRRLGVPGAWLIAAVFGVHPVQVESVAWVTERKNVLSGTFYLLSFLAYWRFAAVVPAPSSAPGKPAGGGTVGTAISGASWAWYGASLLLFMAALLSKSVTCSLPVIIGLLLWWKKPRLSWRDVLPLAPFVALGLVLGLHTAYMEKVIVGAQGAAWALSPIQRCLIAGRALWFYVGKLLWPWPLVFIYPRWPVNAGVAWQYAFPAAWLGLLGALFALRRRLGRGPLVGTLYFSITLFPALGFVNTYPMMYSFVADHFQYLASLGVLAVVLGSAVRLAGQYVPQQRFAAYGAGAVLTACVVLTWSQGLIYQDLETLWLDTYAHNQQSAIVPENLGAFYTNTGQLDKALPLLEAAKDLNPSWVQGYTNLGLVYRAMGQGAQALRVFAAGTQVPPGDARAAADLWSAYGVTLLEQGNKAAALAALVQAVQADPKSVLAQCDLGLLYYQAGDLVRAQDHLQQALALRPAFVPTHLGLGCLCLGRKDYVAAQQHFQMAALLDPRNPEHLRRWAVALVRGGQVELGRGVAQQACALGKNQDPRALLTLAWSLAAARQYAAAAAVAQQAVASGPTMDGALKAEIEHGVQAYQAQHAYDPQGLEGTPPAPVVPGA